MSKTSQHIYQPKGADKPPHVLTVIQAPVTGPKDSYYGNYEDALDEWTLDRVAEQGISTLVYFYANGGYDGSGNALLRKAGTSLWQHQYLGHCSCYGPLENISDHFETLDALSARMSAELRLECAALLDRARQVRQEGVGDPMSLPLRPMTDAELLTHYRMIISPDVYLRAYDAYEAEHGKGSVRDTAIALTAKCIDPRYTRADKDHA